MQPGILILGIVTAYLLGSCPNGLLVARSRGVDIRKAGSGNIGATNVFRIVGKGAGVLVFVLDALKGWIPAYIFPLAAAAWGGSDMSRHTLGIVFGVAAIAGHNWSVYLKFQGGKGVATSAGVLFGVAYLAAMIGLAVWAVLSFSTGYVSLGSIGAAVAVAAAGWALYQGQGMLLPVVLTILGALVIWRHRSNITRLLAGTEHRFRRPWMPRPPAEPDDRTQSAKARGENGS
jgi:glycerol-3-phosphate acyltransferase PlsY